jgi:hypothetical protein
MPYRKTCAYNLHTFSVTFFLINTTTANSHGVVPMSNIENPECESRGSYQGNNVISPVNDEDDGTSGENYPLTFLNLIILS